VNLIENMKKLNRKYERIKNYLSIMADIDHRTYPEEMVNAKFDIMVAMKNKLKELVDEL